MGWSTWEEIDQVANPTGPTVTNFGWPCYEGNGTQSGYLAAGLSSARTSMPRPARRPAPSTPTSTPPRSSPARPARRAARRFPASPSTAPAATRRATRGPSSSPTIRASASGSCFPDAQGKPVASTRATFIAGAATPVDLQIGPGGDLYYADHAGGTIRRVQSFAPTARGVGGSPFRAGPALGAVRRLGVPRRAAGRHDHLCLGLRGRRDLRGLDGGQPGLRLLAARLLHGAASRDRQPRRLVGERSR